MQVSTDPAAHAMAAFGTIAEVIQNILSFVDSGDLLNRTRIVNRQWRNVSEGILFGRLKKRCGTPVDVSLPVARVVGPSLLREPEMASSRGGYMGTAQKTTVSLTLVESMQTFDNQAFEEARFIKNSVNAPFPPETLSLIDDNLGYEALRRLRSAYDSSDIRVAPIDPRTGMRHLGWAAESRHQGGFPVASLDVYFGGHEYSQDESGERLCPFLVHDIQKGVSTARDKDIAIAACGLLKRLHENTDFTSGRIFRGHSSTWLLNYGLELDLTNKIFTLVIPITVLKGVCVLYESVIVCLFPTS